MAIEADSMLPSGPPKRKVRNLLLDSRFQLKYTGAVVATVVVVASVLGYLAFDYSQGQTEALTIQMATQPELDAKAVAAIEVWAQEQDRKIMLQIIMGILILAVTMGGVGIVVTHKIVGPAYKIRQLIRAVAKGKLRVEGRIRRGDELQEVFEAFELMVVSLRERQEGEVQELEQVIALAKQEGVGTTVLGPLTSLRDRMQKAVE